MGSLSQAIKEKGYIPLAASSIAALGWQGEELTDFWMWNGKFNEYEGNIKHIRTVKVRELKEASLHYWRDGWIPIKPITDALLRKMEASLREHPGLKKSGVRVPDGEFLKAPDNIPLAHIGPEVREMLGLPGHPQETPLVPKVRVDKAILSSYAAQLRGAKK